MKKTTLVWIAVFIGLLVGVLVSMQDKSARGITRIDFSSVDPTSVDKVEISGPQAVKLHKDGELWRLDNDKEADSGAVQRMLDAIPSINSSQLVTRNNDRFADLEVDDDKGLSVKAFSGDKLVANFIIGKVASGETHVRVKDEVYGVKGLSRFLFAKDKSAWHQLKFFKTALDDVESVEVKLAGAPAYGLSKKDKDWAITDPSVLPQGFRFDKNAARSLVSSLANLRAQSVEENDPGVDKTGLSDQADSLTLHSKGGVSNTVLLGLSNDDKKVFAKLQGGDDVFLLAEYNAKNLRKKATDLRELTLVQIDKDKVNKLQIQNGKDLLVLSKKDGAWSIDKSSVKVPDDFKFDPSAVDRRLGAMANARAFQLAQDQDAGKASLRKPSATITATLDDNSQVRLQFGKEFELDKRKLVYARGNIDDSIYALTGYLRDSLCKGLDGFKKTAPAPNAMGGPGGGLGGIDPSSLANLPPEVRAQLMQQLQQKQRQQQMMQQIKAQAPAPPSKEKAKAKHSGGQSN